VADVDVTYGSEIINREKGQRRVVVMSNVRGTDLGSFVAEGQQKVNANVPFPPGYAVSYEGQFENQPVSVAHAPRVLYSRSTVPCAQGSWGVDWSLSLRSAQEQQSAEPNAPAPACISLTA
jgi:hypothetical protein